MVRRMRLEGVVPEGLTLGQISALTQLQKRPGQTNAELARHDRITPQAMSVMVSALVKKGLIARERDGQDGRRHRLSITDAGAEILHTAQKRRTDWLVAELDEKLTPQEQQELAKALEYVSRLAPSS